MEILKHQLIDKIWVQWQDVKKKKTYTEQTDQADKLFYRQAFLVSLAMSFLGPDHRPRPWCTSRTSPWHDHPLVTGTAKGKPGATGQVEVSCPWKNTMLFPPSATDKVSHLLANDLTHMVRFHLVDQTRRQTGSIRMPDWPAGKCGFLSHPQKITVLLGKKMIMWIGILQIGHCKMTKSNTF